MKSRQGFVSNSSSSSFLIYGVSIEDNALLDVVMKIKSLEELASDMACEATEEAVREELEALGRWDLAEYLYGCEDLELEGSGDIGYYLGLSWDSVKDDETGAQFKQRVADNLKRVGIKESPCTISEAWHD